MRRIIALLQKEWLELRQDRSLVASTLLPPLILSLLPIGVVYALGTLPPDPDTDELGAALANPAFAGMPSDQLIQAVIGSQFATLFILMPLLIPTIIAAYSIVGEKSRRTLEPLLATPLKTWELLVAKSLTALIPAVGLTWLCGGLFALGIALVSRSARVFAAIVSPAWLLVLLLCVPPLALISVAGSVMVSSRVNDPRTAQQLAGVVVVPVLLVFFSQLAGLLVLSPGLAIGSSVVLTGIAVLLILMANSLFERETILTRWK